MYLDGHPIPQTPFGVKVGPATLHAPACAVRGLADACPHGMLEFEVHGRDAFGNSLQLLPRCAWALSRSRNMGSPPFFYPMTRLFLDFHPTKCRWCHTGHGPGRNALRWQALSHNPCGRQRVLQGGSCNTYTAHAGCWRCLRSPRNAWRMWRWRSGRRPQSSPCAAM